MKNSIFLFVFMALLVADRITGRSIKDNSSNNQSVERYVRRNARGIGDLFNFRGAQSTTTESPASTTLKPRRQNIKECKDHEKNKKDKVIYIEEINFNITANNTRLFGSIEIYIDSPYTITCIEVLDETPNGNGADMDLVDGGEGHKFMKIEVQGKYGHGIFMRIVVRGVEIESEMTEIVDMQNRVRERMANGPKYKSK